MQSVTPLTKEETVALLHDKYDVDIVRMSSQYTLNWWLDHVDLTGAKLAGAYLPSVRFVGTKLDGADLRGAVLTGAKFNKARLSDAHLDGAKLDGTDIVDSWLKNAKLRETDLSRAMLKRSVFDHAVMTGVQSDGIKIKGSSFWGVRGLSEELKSHILRVLQASWLEAL